MNKNMEISEQGAGGTPVPLPRPRKTAGTKPTPKPRTPRLYPRLTPELREELVEEEEGDLDWEKIPDKPHTPSLLQEGSVKRGTINIFKLATTLNDPFDDFDAEFVVKGGDRGGDRDAKKKNLEGNDRVLSQISFTSPLNDLDEKTRQRISTFSSLSSASTDDSDHYMEPPSARLVPAQIAAGLSTKTFNGSVSNFWRKEEDQDVSMGTGGHIRALSCPVAPLAREEEQEYETVEQQLAPPVLPNTLPPNLNFGDNKRITFPNFFPTNDNDNTFERHRDKFDTFTSTISSTTTELWRKGSVRSLASDTESTHSFQFDRTSTPRSSGSSIRKKIHEYDDVAIEDGTVVVLDNARLSDDTNNNSSVNSRDSVIAEFDPLLTPTGIITMPTKHADKDHDHRYEYIDTEAEDGRSSCSNNEDVVMEDSFPVDFTANFAKAPETLEEEYEVVEPPEVPQKPQNEPSSPPTPSPTSPQKGVEPASFFRRFSSKFGLKSIKEERVVEVGGQCKKCRMEHPENVKCKFTPSYRETVVFSTNLYKAGGLGRKDWSKKRVVLAKGKLAFYNDKSEVVWELPLEKIAVISKKEGPAALKYFELGLVHWKNSSLVLAGADEGERANWMMKYVDAHTTSFPPVVTSSFDRGGWCYIKETVTSDWRPGWLILRERTLFYSYHNSKEYLEMDLRKARSIEVGSKEEEQRCPWADNGEVLTLDLICRILYIQTESGKITQSWEKAIRAAATSNGPQFHEMQLTLDEVPVIVDKCIDFLYAHGTLAEGIYRQSGSNSRIAQLLAEFQKDAWQVQILPKEFSAHDVAGTLKRFFRTLPEPLVTSQLYPEWIRAANISAQGEKEAELIRLLEAMPPINYNIMKRLMCHLYAVHELHEKNLMPLMNLAAIWGPTLMNVDDGAAASYNTACAESEVVKELIEGYYTLFRVEEVEREKERRMQDALENFHLGSLRRKCSGDMKFWIYLWEKDDSSTFNVTLTPYSTAQGIVSQIMSNSRIRNVDNVSLHEVICAKGLERPLHPMEKVIETVLRWSIWEVEERKNNYLILKKNSLYPQLLQYTKDAQKLGADVRWADSRSKSFRKGHLHLSQGSLKLFKDSKCTVEQGSWTVEEVVWYVGCEAKRTSVPTIWTLTLVKKTYPFKRSKEEPYFGSVVCCNSEEELHRCLGALVLTAHPEGLYPSVFV